LALVNLAGFENRLPETLSGGQQQRVALARALVNRPACVLLDEPLGALDQKLRERMQSELRLLQKRLGLTFIFVTHDQEEALSMSDRVVVMNEGNIEQIGTPRQVYEKPQNLTVAKFIGEVNIFDSEVTEVAENKVTVNIEGKQRTFKSVRQFTIGQRAHILVRPEDFRVWGSAEVEDTQEMFPGVVEEVIYKGTTVDLMVRLSNNQLVAATEFFDEDDDRLEYAMGEKVWTTWLSGWEVILPHEA
jgi:spermidine/putrescine transport system ATP-binding protein